MVKAIFRRRNKKRCPELCATPVNRCIIVNYYSSFMNLFTKHDYDHREPLIWTALWFNCSCSLINMEIKTHLNSFEWEAKWRREKRKATTNSIDIEIKELLLHIQCMNKRSDKIRIHCNALVKWRSGSKDLFGLLSHLNIIFLHSFCVFLVIHCRQIVHNLPNIQPIDPHFKHIFPLLHIVHTAFSIQIFFPDSLFITILQQVSDSQINGGCVS